ncbi:MAG: PRC-barrel domain-containing protein [Chloroflexota bacterium]|nr:PRC-barrel domain-containing protein [Chloroflexota bacterium]
MAAGDPISYLTLQRGTDVLSSEGERVGVVEHVLGDEGTGIFDGIIIDTRLGPGGLRFVDAPEVEALHEDAVVLDVPAAEVERLPKPEPGPAVMEHHGVEDSESELEHKLRRAWEVISGRG